MVRSRREQIEDSFLACIIYFAVSLCRCSLLHYCPFYFYIVIFTLLVLSYLCIERVQPSGNPCVPSPCGPNSQCRVVGSTAACSCLPNYVGKSPNCRPECTINAECASNKACQNERCRDPCPGSCGPLAHCRVVNHTPLCTCPTGYTGDPFSGCSLAPSKNFAIFTFYYRVNTEVQNAITIYLVRNLVFTLFPTCISFFL
jgi:hypothetical protein